MANIENFHGYIIEDFDSANPSQCHNVLDARDGIYKFCQTLPAYTQLVINKSGSYKIQTGIKSWEIYNVPASRVFQALEYSKPDLPF